MTSALGVFGLMASSASVISISLSTDTTILVIELNNFMSPFKKFFESQGVGYRYVHNDGRGLMNNSSLNYDKLSDDDYMDVEEEYLGLQQPPSTLHNQQLMFVFTAEGLQKHQRLIELLTKASKTGVRIEEVPLSRYQVVWDSGDGQLGLAR